MNKYENAYNHDGKDQDYTQSKLSKTERKDDKNNDAQYQDFHQYKRAKTEGKYYRKGNNNTLLAYVNKRKAEAN
eukprot:6826350-Heterocapsa_arctica.AAC.1